MKKAVFVIAFLYALCLRFSQTKEKDSPIDTWADNTANVISKQWNKTLQLTSIKEGRPSTNQKPRISPAPLPQKMGNNRGLYFNSWCPTGIDCGISGYQLITTRESNVTRICTFGDFLFVGEYQATVEGFAEMGKVTIFQRIRNRWREIQIITPPAKMASQQFGYSLDAEDGYLVVGAPGNNGKNNAGAVYLYKLNETRWDYVRSFNDPSRDESRAAGRGTTVAISKNNIVCGLPGIINPTTLTQGEVEIYRTNGVDWYLETTLADPTGDTQYFGYSLDATPDKIVIGGLLGVVHVLHYIQGTGWLTMGRLRNPTGSSPNNFGAAVKIERNQILVGDPESNRGEGEAYLFRYSSPSWRHVQTFTHPDAFSNDRFGVQVTLENENIIIASSNDEIDDRFEMGTMHWYQQRVPGGPYEYKTIIYDQAGIGGAFLGGILTLRNKRFVTGASGPAGYNILTGVL